MSGITLDRNDEYINVRVPMKMKRRGGRKIVVLSDKDSPQKIGCDLSLATVVARAYH